MSDQEPSEQQQEEKPPKENERKTPYQRLMEQQGKTFGGRGTEKRG